MDAHWMLLALALLSVTSITAALVRANGPMPPFWTTWAVVASELAAFQGAVLLVALAVIALFTKELQQDAGRLGALLVVASWTGLIVVAARGRRTRGVLDAALRAALGDDYRHVIPHSRRAVLDERIPHLAILQPCPHLPRSVEMIRDIPYPGGHQRNTLDLYRPSQGCTDAPVLLYLHGDEWSKGHKRQQSMPLLHHLAALGWVVAAPNYRLSPGARFPAHLVDCKSAFAWVRGHVADFGGNPRNVAVAGGAAGAHLAALVALTFGNMELQPGFEQIDTRPAACVSLYGWYDLVDRQRRRAQATKRHAWLGSHFMPCALERDPAAWALASPIAQVRPDAPPFLILHGTHDAVVPAREARAFAAQLRGTSMSPVAYAELPGAHHRWDGWRSLRTMQCAQGIARFLQWSATQYSATGSPRNDSPNHASH